MNHLNTVKCARLIAGAAMATLISAFFAVGIDTGVITPQLAPLDPAPVVWALSPAAAAALPGA